MVGVLWISLSDLVVAAIEPDPTRAARLQTFKGWLFIALTAALLYYLLRDALARLQRASAAKVEAEQTALRNAILTNHSGDILLLVRSHDGQVLEANDAAIHAYGLDRDALRTRRMDDLCAACALPPPGAHRNGSAPKSAVQLLHRRADGTTFPVETSTHPRAIGDTEVVVVVARDVTARQKMEAALRDTEQRFREVVDTIREVFWIYDVARRRLVYVSPGFEKIWGSPFVESRESPQPWLNSIRPEDRERVQRAYRTRELTGIYDETYRILRPDQSLRWIRDRGYPVRDDAGKVIRIVGTAEDITDRKKLEEQFLHAQRLEAIGTLASGVAHDLNNILTPLFMFAPVMKDKLTNPADLQILDMIERSVERAASIVRQLLTFSRGLSGERGPLQVRHLLKEMATITHETFPRSIRVSQSAPGDLWPVVGDATQLHQVLMNLCVNARDAMPNGGQLSLTAQNVTLTEAHVRLMPHARPGRYAMISVADTGEGIPPEIRPRIFDPFFTTKDLGKGTGLGLSTVLGIVKSHGGFVTVDSEPGAGAEFCIYLPADAPTPLPCTAPDRVSLPLGDGEVVLVVDDEAAVRDTTRHALECHGYRVHTAADGREALNIFYPRRQAIRAVVTDLIMPEMGGLALIDVLRELRPNLPIIAASGLDQPEDKNVLAGYRVTEVLSKPYTPHDLVAALQRELRRNAAAD